MANENGKQMANWGFNTQSLSFPQLFISKLGSIYPSMSINIKYSNHQHQLTSNQLSTPTLLIFLPVNSLESSGKKNLFKWVHFRRLDWPPERLFDVSERRQTAAMLIPNNLKSRLSSLPSTKLYITYPTLGKENLLQRYLWEWLCFFHRRVLLTSHLYTPRPGTILLLYDKLLLNKSIKSINPKAYAK